MLKHIGLCLLVVLGLCVSIAPTALAQQRTISGIVTRATDGAPLPGVNVIIKNTLRGTTTDVDGGYQITVDPANDVLVFSFIGFKTQERDIQEGDRIDVALEDDIALLDAVVVTALGVERRTRDLGYAVQSVDVADLETVRDANLLNSLSGRLAGVQINNGSSGVGSSSRIVIRGEASFTDNVQPLIVLDGVPIANDLIANDVFNDGTGFQEVDYGNGLGELSLDDIESINVLKGPAATALYGSRGANGVLVLTSRTGRSNQGIGVSFSTSLTFDNVLRIPEYQNEYGQGSNGQFSYVNGLYDGVEDGEDISWGPLMDGQLISQFDSPALGLDGAPVRAGDVVARGGAMDRSLLPNNSITATPFTTNADNVADFFQTGTTVRNNFAFSGNNPEGYYRVSYSNLLNNGVIPGTNLERHGLSLSGGYDLSDRLSARTFISYINSASTHRPGTGYGSENPMYMFTWYGRQVDTESLRDYWQVGQEDIQQFNYNYAWHDNPFFSVFENRNGFDKDRILGNAALTYAITSRLSVTLRSGLDTYDDLRKSQRAFSTQRFRNGAYREDNVNYTELNTDVLARYVAALGPDWGLTVSAGGNRLDQTSRYKSVTAGELIVPNIYNLENSRIPLVTNQFNARKRINSVYALGQTGWRERVYLDVSLRNDWSSALPEDNNSYLYGSASLSAIVSELVDLPDAINFAKVRVSAARVGNDTQPYQLTNTYVYRLPYGGTQLVTANPSLANSDISPERIDAVEAGAELNFFASRLKLDVTYYQSLSQNQIVALPTSVTSGYSSRVLNSAEIENKGVEIILGITPLATRDAMWASTFNFSRNVSRVAKLPEGIDQYVTNFGRVYGNTSRSVWIIATEGGRMGDMWGTGLQQVEVDGEMRSVYVDGIPQKDSNLRKIGNYNPDFMLGWDNSFRWRSVEFGFLFDLRYGGKIVSRTLAIASTSGNLINSLGSEGDEAYGTGDRETGIVGDGVQWHEASQAWIENDVAEPAQSWYNRFYDRDNEENALYDATYLKLREVRLGYRLPARLVTRLGATQAVVSIIGRNLAVWTENPHFDPELNAMQGNRFVQGVEDMSYPSSRSFGFNVQLQF